MRRRRSLLRVAAVTVFVVAAAGGCGDSGDAPQASNCEQLVQGAAAVVQSIVHDLQGKTDADLRATNPADPYAELLRPFDAYRDRATQLGCDQSELVRVACREYREIQPTGAAAEEFLADMIRTCN